MHEAQTANEGIFGRHHIALHIFRKVQTASAGVLDNCAGNKVVEFTDRTAAEVDEKIKERQERNKVLHEPVQ